MRDIESANSAVEMAMSKEKSKGAETEVADDLNASPSQNRRVKTAER